MSDEQQEQEAGQKGGAAETYMTAPAVMAVTEMAIPADRIQWGPTFAGLVVALSVTFIFSALGLALGFALAPAGFGGALGLWMTGFACLGLFLGSALAARTAKASHLWPAALHGIVVWSLLMMLDIIGNAGVIRGMNILAIAAIKGGPLARFALSELGWWFFCGYLVMLIAAVLGGMAGMTTSRETHA